MTKSINITIADVEKILKETSVISDTLLEKRTHLFTVETLEFAAKQIYHKLNS